MELEKLIAIVNPSGLHARPCHAIVSIALEHECDLRIGLGDREVNGRSILELMTLGAAHGDEVRVITRGKDAEQLIKRLSSLFECGFEESL